eukprot:10697510-Ditylum_brightwellii.AAC.1
MGQKTHPLGFRLGITQEHRAAWYADFKQYSNLLEEDDKIRRPGVLVGDNGSKIKTLAANIKKFIPNDRQITINVIEVENANSNASLIADLVVQQLEDRVAFRRAIREGLKCSQDNAKWPEANGFEKDGFRYKR